LAHKAKQEHDCQGDGDRIYQQQKILWRFVASNSNSWRKIAWTNIHWSTSHSLLNITVSVYF